MNKQTEALKLALEALDWAIAADTFALERINTAITAIREALTEQDEYGGEFVELSEQPARKPVFIMGEYVGNGRVDSVSFGIPQGVWKQPAQQQCEYCKRGLKAGVCYCKPAQEPVAYMDICEKGQMSGLRFWSEPDNRHEIPLYTSPPAQQQEPVAGVVIREGLTTLLQNRHIKPTDQRLYTSPQPSKQWVGLTDGNYRWMWSAAHNDTSEDMPWLVFARAIEAKLREKNSITGESK